MTKAERDERKKAKNEEAESQTNKNAGFYTDTASCSSRQTGRTDREGRPLMGAEKNNQPLYPDQLPSAGRPRRTATGRPEWAAKPWRPTPRGAGGSRVWSKVSLASLSKCSLEKMGFWLRGQEELNNWKTSAMCLYLLGRHSKGQRLEEIRDQRQLDWKFPEVTDLSFFISAVFKMLQSENSNWIKVKKLQKT